MLILIIFMDTNVVIIPVSDESQTNPRFYAFDNIMLGKLPVALKV